MSAAASSPTDETLFPFSSHTGARVHLLATSGPPGVAALSDTVAPGDPAAVVVGWAVFGPAEKYETADAFAADAHRHRVPPDSVYAWREGRDTYGWPVLQVGAVEEPQPPAARGTRVLRSIFTFDGDPAG